MLSILQDANAVERSHRTDDEEFYRLQRRGFKDLKDFMVKASEWIYYYNYDRSHDGLGGKSPAEALQKVTPKLPRDILFLPPIILDDRITLLGGGTEVYRHYTVFDSGSTGLQGVARLVPKVEALVVGFPLLPEGEDYLHPLVGQGSSS